MQVGSAGVICIRDNKMHKMDVKSTLKESEQSVSNIPPFILFIFDFVLKTITPLSIFIVLFYNASACLSFTSKSKFKT